MYKEWMISIPELMGGQERRAFIYVPDEAYADGGFGGSENNGGGDHDNNGSDNNAQRRYPVLYMFDGQNLYFDEAASFGKSWGLMRYLEENNIPLILASIECNHYPEESPFGGRLSEYTPFDFSDPHWGDIKARGSITMNYYVNEFKPYIDANYPTLPDRNHTFIGGSSMGGLMTLYALMCFNETFSRGCALSPSLCFSFLDIMEMTEQAKIAKTWLYMDNGSKEMGLYRFKDAYAEVTAALIKKGVFLESRVIPNGTHSEGSWEKQIPFFIDSLFYDLSI